MPGSGYDHQRAEAAGTEGSQRNGGILTEEALAGASRTCERALVDFLDQGPS